MASGPNIVAVSIGNTRTALGLFEGGEITERSAFANTDLDACGATIVDWWRRIENVEQASIVLAGVSDPVADELTKRLEPQVDTTIYRIGRDLEIPIGRRLDPDTKTGVDRLLNAAAAYANVKQACIIVDAGTAVTVDFVDGEGTFHGGAIAPGAQLQLDAMHEHTAALPQLQFAPPDVQTFGRSTEQAMLNGVFHGVRGLVWKLVEHYSERYGAFPIVIATGGDAATIFEHDELIDRIVSDLTLIGLSITVGAALGQIDESEQST
jgi:type III pantothenate kinase